MLPLTPSICTDLHIGNVLLDVPGLNQMSRHDLEPLLAAPMKGVIRYIHDRTLVPPSPHRPKYILVSPDRVEFLQCLPLTFPSAIDPKICDFGESLLWDMESKNPASDI